MNAVLPGMNLVRQVSFQKKIRAVWLGYFNIQSEISKLGRISLHADTDSWNS